MEDIRKRALEKLRKKMKEDYEKGRRRAFELMEGERMGHPLFYRCLHVSIFLVSWL